MTCNDSRRPRFRLNAEPGLPGYMYKAMADHVAARIESGELAPYSALPSEREFAKEYGVSLGTARHATQILRDRGLVVTIRSKGTFVAGRSQRER
ncbi:GntR family transcriptional regulator [Amycolatopsis thermoflava]